jgi:hypothetical protein
MAYWNACTKSSDRCYTQLKLMLLIQLPPMMSMSFLTNLAQAIHSTYHTVLKTSPGAAIFGQDMLFDIPFVADWHKIGERRQSLTDHGNQRKNAKRIDYDYKLGDKILVINEGILHKAESSYGKEPWTITTAHTNGTIRIQHGTRMEQLSIQRVQPFTDDIL